MSIIVNALNGWQKIYMHETPTWVKEKVTKRIRYLDLMAGDFPNEDFLLKGNHFEYKIELRAKDRYTKKRVTYFKKKLKK
jgi:hypothetical protein